MDARVDGVNDRFGEELQAGLSNPLVLNGLKFGTVLAAVLGGDHEVVKGLERRVCTSDDVVVIAGVDGGGDERGGFRVSTGNGEKIDACKKAMLTSHSIADSGEVRQARTHNVSLCSNGNEPIDVLANRYEHLSGHVSALLRSRSLILNMYARSAFLDKHLGELHDGGETTMSSICVGNDRTKKVSVGGRGTLIFGQRKAFFALFTVME